MNITTYVDADWGHSSYLNFDAIVIKGQFRFGITFPGQSSMNIATYVDADWGELQSVSKTNLWIMYIFRNYLNCFEIEAHMDIDFPSSFL